MTAVIFVDAAKHHSLRNDNSRREKDPLHQLQHFIVTFVLWRLLTKQADALARGRTKSVHYPAPLLPPGAHRRRKFFQTRVYGFEHIFIDTHPKPPKVLNL